MGFKGGRNEGNCRVTFYDNCGDTTEDKALSLRVFPPHQQQHFPASLSKNVVHDCISL